MEIGVYSGLVLMNHLNENGVFCGAYKVCKKCLIQTIFCRGFLLQWSPCKLCVLIVFLITRSCICVTVMDG